MTSTEASASTPRVERAVGVRGDLELALGERRGGAGERRVAGCAGWIAAATSRRIVHASLWDSSKSTLMLARRAGSSCRTVINADRDRDVNVDFRSSMRKNPANGRH